jgi:hypothetical protein
VSVFGDCLHFAGPHTFDRDLIVNGSDLAAAPINTSAQLVAYAISAEVCYCSNGGLHLLHCALFFRYLALRRFIRALSFSNFGHGCMHVAPSTRAYCERMCA